MSTEIKFGDDVTLDQAAGLISSVPEVRFFLEGEPGIGKSSLLPRIGEMLGFDADQLGYVDCGNMDLGDTAMPVINHEEMVTNYYPNSRFQIRRGSDRPVIIMLDEFTKGPDPVKNMLHPLLEQHNPRLGDIPLPKRSIVFLTGNLATDGVGDSLKAHSRNRVVSVRVSKPDSDQWLGWAARNDVDATVMAFVNQFPQTLASYTEGAGQNENPYIFNPTRVQNHAVVTPRSLVTASSIVKKRAQNDSDAVIAALKGAIGESAARDMQAFIAYQDELPSWEEIISNPLKAKVPTKPGANAVLIFGAISRIEAGNIGPLMKYVRRFEPEWQACFAITASKSPAKQSLVFSDESFTTWARENTDIL